ncbi:jg20065 [Pararge aegeria aegeria]|uniref:Jg20065 protein n=1 Tax=Pararge aegeria aegeria TaxID=348720 RepID=A0A8S4SQT0_9NEOP|nr:jg20065 [Pararge aegeria aegeria]
MKRYQCCIRGDYIKVYWEVQGPGPPGAINERSAWARALCGSRADVPPALYSPGPSMVLEFHTSSKINNATGFLGTYSFIDKHECFTAITPDGDDAASGRCYVMTANERVIVIISLRLHHHHHPKPINLPLLGTGL